MIWQIATIPLETNDLVGWWVRDKLAAQQPAPSFKTGTTSQQDLEESRHFDSETFSKLALAVRSSA